MFNPLYCGVYQKNFWNNVPFAEKAFHFTAIAAQALVFRIISIARGNTSALCMPKGITIYEELVMFSFITHLCISTVTGYFYKDVKNSR